MVRIPIPNSNVQAQGTPGGLMNPNVPAAAFGQALGEGLMGVAHAAEQVQHQADVLRVEEAASQLRERQLKITGWVQGLRGKQALDPSQFGGQAGQDLGAVARVQLDEASQEIGAGLANDRQRAMFDQASRRFNLELQAQAQHHVQQQTGVVAEDTYKGALAVEDQAVSQNALTPDGRLQAASIAQSLARKVHAAEQVSYFLGEPEDMRKMRVLQAQSGTHAIVLDALLKANNAQGAQAYFDVHRDQMDPKLTSVMEGRINDNIMAGQVQTQADRIEALGLPIDKQDAEARKAMAGKPDGLKALQAELEHRWTIQQTATNAATREVTGKLWDMRFPTLPGQQAQGLPAIMRTQEWAALNGTQRNELRSQWEAYAKRNENDPSVVVERSLAYFNVINDPNFTKLTDNQIKALQGKLGPQLTVQVMKDLQEIRTNPGRVQEVQVDNQLLESTGREMGLVKGPKLTDEEKANLGKVAVQLKMLQQGTGQKWTYENQKLMLRQLMTPIVTSTHWWRSDEKAPLFEVQQSTAIPQKFIDTVNAKAAARGVTAPSSAEVYQLWFSYKDLGLVDEQGNVKGVK